jgi:S-DNA-T family DNA segregation ATPase FtsK/SpoIIIE
MAKKSKEKDSYKTADSKERKNPAQAIKKETRNGIFSVVSFVVALFFILSAFGNAGPAGKFFFEVLTYLFGLGYYLLPVILMLLGVSYLRSERPDVGLLHVISSAFVLLASLGMIDIIDKDRGGVVGGGASFPFMKLFGTDTSMIFLLAILVISLSVLFDRQPNIWALALRIWNWLKNLFSRHAEEISDEEMADSEEVVIEVKHEEEKAEEEKSEPKPKKRKKKEESEEENMEMAGGMPMGSYVPPPLSLLEEDKGKPGTGDIKANSNIIKRTLQNFGIEVEMDEITIGPTVTRYALKPAEGVKLAKIVALQNDLSLALAAHPLRIEAPIPGKSLVGIEIPNKIKSTVGLATLLSDEKFAGSLKPLTIALGKSIAGKSFFANLAKMPHALIAGATGSGKSVTIHAIITSLLYRNGPEAMRFIMIDPKRVELTLYNKIPHLLTPVITQPKQAILALKWAAKEMDRRYNILEKESVRDIESYHKTISGKKAKDGETIDPMPYIVIIIDELADIMTSYPRELESAIVRLAQMSRAVGIHLILSTQRPSVNVITGLIKANVPARIALQVSSQIDSRTILDASGAEKLLGAGDMLYLSGEMSQPERLQSAFITETEVKNVVKYLAGLYKDALPSEIMLSGGIGAEKTIFDGNLEDSGDGDDDDMYEEARIVVIQAGKASTSYIQRKLKVGYARAARLIDMLEERGIVGPGDGAKPREVLEKPVDHISNPEARDGEFQ